MSDADQKAATCPRCRMDISADEIRLPIVVDGRVVDGGCIECWEQDCVEEVWRLRRTLTASPARRRMPWIEVVGWAATLIAVGGVMLNNRQSVWCFALWLVSNSLTAVIHYRSRLWALTCRDLLFLALAVDGWVRWTR